MNKDILYNPINLLFEYIRNHKWDKFIELLDSDDTIDINVKDNQSNYLMTYAVKFNKPDIVQILLNKGAKYDIVDKMEKSILYDAIESNFIEIIEYILEYSNNNIGIMATDIRDLNGNIPLHYAIKFKNVVASELLVKYKSNLYTTDNDGYNALHLAIRSGSFLICKEIIKNMSNLDIKTFKGETALHISINYQFNLITELLLNEGADPDIIDNENEFTGLHYAVGWNNIEVINMLIKKNANPNIQDIYGNVPLMYCIKENYVEAFDIIIKHYESNEQKINLNLWNISGKILLHEVLENYADNKKHYVDILIGESGLSIQDINGNTCMHYLVILKLWDKYIDIIKTKKINIFAKNIYGKAIIDLIYTDDKHDLQKIAQYNKFIDMITEGYIQILKKEKKENNITWIDELDKICSRDLSELNDNEKKIIGNINTQSDIDTSCTLLIRNKLVGDIKKYRDGKLAYCQRSYPVSNSQYIDISEGPHINVCTFTGSLLDVLVGLMYLLKKHNNACTTIGKNITPNDSLCKFYKSMGLIMNGRCEFINFEIVWIDYKLYMIDNFFELFDTCVKSKARFVIIPIGIEMKSGSHANYLIYDKHVKEVERFEPHGGTTTLIGFNYNSQYLDEVLSDYFKSIDKDIQYIKPKDYIPKIGFQLMDSQEDKNKRIGDPGGFCALWSIWYVDQRLTYHSYDRKTLIENLFDNIKIQGISYRNMIRNYSKNIINQRDILLKKINIDINDWLNDNYTYTQLDKFISILINELNTCCIIKKN